MVNCSVMKVPHGATELQSMVAKRIESLAIVILAAGRGERMQSSKCKVMHKVAQQPLLEYALKTAHSVALRFSEVETVIVVNELLEQDDEFIELWEQYRDIHLKGMMRTVVQREQLGTGHAVATAITDVTADLVLVLYGDTPFVSLESIMEMLDRLTAAPQAAAIIMAFDAADPAGYGRIVLDEEGAVVRVIEDKDATAQQRAITLCNAGIFLGRCSILREFLHLDSNAQSYGNGSESEEGYEYSAEHDSKSVTQGGGGVGLASRSASKKTAESIVSHHRTPQRETGQQPPISKRRELYLPDMIPYAAKLGYRSLCLQITDRIEATGINDRTQLAEAEHIMQQRLRQHLLNNGVTMIAPETVFLAADTKIGRDTVIQPYVVFGRHVNIGSASTILSFCDIAGTESESGVVIGPFARIRPKTLLKNRAKVGNFVEIKNGLLGERVRASHLAYLGDAEVGDDSNIGAGTVICNYNGKKKTKSHIGKGSFIGSNSTIVSPVQIGDGSNTAAGTVVTEDVPDRHIAMARIAQVNLSKVTRGDDKA